MLKRLISYNKAIISRFHHSTAISLDHRALIQVHGNDASTFLQGLITNDIEFLKHTNAIYAMLLNVRGRILYDMIIYNHSPSLISFIPAENQASVSVNTISIT